MRVAVSRTRPLAASRSESRIYSGLLTSTIRSRVKGAREGLHRHDSPLYCVLS
jgi:hypothetical protein